MVTNAVTVPPYMNRLHIIFLENLEKDLPLFNKKYNDDLTPDNVGLGAAHRRGHHVLIYICVETLHKRFDKSATFDLELLSTITHEAVHACNFIFINKGIKLDLNNDEPQAYLTDWIVREIYKVYLKTIKTTS